VKIGILGVGATGARAARQLVDAPEVDTVVLAGGRKDRIQSLAASLPDHGIAATDPVEVGVDGLICAGPVGSHLAAVRRALASGVPVVSTSDGPDEVEAIFSLSAEATERQVAVVVGAAFAPGMSCLLAAHGAQRFDEVDEIHVARAGAGGPACAHQHHDALSGTAIDWRDGGWQERRSGSGRELVWFPDPIGARDCYRASLADPFVLVDAFPTVRRVTARLAAHRRDRLTARFPMLRNPPAEGGPGAIRVELRGRVGERSEIEVYGAIDRPAVASGAVAAAAIRRLVRGEARRTGVGGLAAMFDSGPFLSELSSGGVRAAVFEGSHA
jgi:saccharopine dehydrogenase-like NADP-dependent oxidoreductase